MKKIAAVFGTRPEAIKMCPLIKELRRRGADVRIILSGQHKEMADSVMNVFGLSADINLSVMREGQDLGSLSSRLTNVLDMLYKKEKFDTVMVHGDTLTAFFAGILGFFYKIPVAHIEAGLRTYDINNPYPEEFCRRAISLISSYNFAPTESAMKNLLSEGVNPLKIFVSGNTVIDAICQTLNESYTSPLLDFSGRGRLVILTAHRRENIGLPMESSFVGIRRVVESYPDLYVIYPVHKNPRVRECAERVFSGCKRIKLVEPLSVVDFHNLLYRAYFVITDSGGIQEEASYLGKPILLMRCETERPEGILSGNIKIIGNSEASVFSGICSVLENKDEYEKMSQRSFAFGDGSASKKIADVLLK